MINHEIQNELSSALNPNETLLWTGKPRTGIILRATDAFLIPFSIVWGGFAIFWEVTAIMGDAPVFFWLFGVPFVFVGLYIMIGRFFFDARKRAGTMYAITSDRIIIKSGIISQEIKSLHIKTLPSISLKQKSDKSGTITFGQPDFKANMMQGMDWPGVNQPPKFEFIEDVKRVYDIIIELQNHGVIR